MDITGLKHTKDHSMLENDKELIVLAIEGKQSAFTALSAKYRSQIENYISTFISNKEEIEDITQEVFNKAFSSLQTYDTNYAFSTWIYSIAKNSCIDFYRKRRPQFTEIPEESSLSNKDFNSIIEISPEEKVISEQEISILISNIENLDVKYRKVAFLRFIKEYAYEEISSDLDLPINTVKTRLKRARKKLIDKWKN